MVANTNNHGFTLVELMLAMVVFSTVLVIATVGFIGMNRTYQRGVIKNQLSEGIQAFTEDVTKSLRAQPINVLPKYCNGMDATCTGIFNGWQWLSLTNVCYMWPLTGSDNIGGLYKSQGPCNTTSDNGKILLLSDRYVVREAPKIALVNVDGSDVRGAQLYSVSGVFTTIEESAIHKKDSGNPNDHWRCKGTAEDSAVSTCAVEEFNFNVNPRGNSL